MIRSLTEKFPEYEKGRKTTKRGQGQNKKKEESKKTENELRKKELLEAKIRHQVACEEKAFRIVERLIENPIAEDFLIDACQFIAPQHYDDIVEERAITKTCGYPLCSKPLTSVLKQKYHISTKDNKVYDITERKNFCSNQCYKASRYLQDQLSTSPLWGREEKQERVRVQLMTLNSGLPGIEVVGPTEILMKEVHQLRKLDALDSKFSKEAKVKHRTDAVVRIREENLKSEGMQDEIKEISCKTEKLTLTEKIESKTKDPELDSDDENEETLESLVTRTKENVFVGDSDKSHSTCSKPEPITGTNKTVCSTEESVVKTGNQNPQTDDKMLNLMKLLDRRKKLLGQLADKETMETEPEISMACGTEGKSIHNTKFSVESNVPLEKSAGRIEKAVENHSKTTDSDKNFVVSERKYVVDTKQNTPETYSQNCENKKDQMKPSNAKTYQRQSSHSVIQMICHSMQSWITPETIRYVQPVVEQDQTSINQSRADYDVMYKALCRRIDAGEFEIEDVGKEAELDGEDNYRQRIPNYELLKAETDDYTDRVTQYFAGYDGIKPVEKIDKDKTPVYLPTVDSHDQMQIRRRIVMDKLQGVLSDVLSPLKLTIQDVYTEYKEIIATFRLDSKNISFKPAEWTIINLILLRIMSKKNEKIHRAFLLPSSVSYFKILLGKLGTNLSQIDSFVNDLLLWCQ